MTALFFISMFMEEFIKAHPNVRYITAIICIVIMIAVLAYQLKNYLKDRECEKQLSEINTMVKRHREVRHKMENGYEELLREYELELN